MDAPDTPQARMWVAACSHRLQRQWRTVDPEQLEELAVALWQDAGLRRLEPEQAAVQWLLKGMPNVERASHVR
jgi:hypothetical protein